MSSLGFSDDLPITEDASGYRSSATGYRMDLLPAKAVLSVAKVIADGAGSHGEGNWKRGAVEKHLDKMLAHAFAYLAGDRGEDHIGHMATRAMFALEVYLDHKDVVT